MLTTDLAFFQGIADLMAFTTFHLFFAAVLIELILSAFVDGGHFSHDEVKFKFEMQCFVGILFWMVLVSDINPVKKHHAKHTGL